MPRPTSGRATVLGRDYRDLVDPGSRVGVMLDASAQHPGRTGREALVLAALTIGVPRSRVDDVLRLVGLSDDEAGRRESGERIGEREALAKWPEAVRVEEPEHRFDVERERVGPFPNRYETH